MDLQPSARIRSFSLCGMMLLAVPAPAIPSTQVPRAAEEGPDAAAGVVGDSGKLERRFVRWVQERGESRDVAFRLGWSKARSGWRSTGRGLVTVRRPAGRLEVQLEGLVGRRSVDVWLVPFGDDESGARRVCGLGLSEGAGRAAIPLRDLADFELERVVVTRAGGNPSADSLLHGAPNLFDRLAASGRTRIGGLPLGLGEADLELDGEPDLDELVGLGERIFFGETFGGNGRTCGTCHPAENDFTLDPRFIAGLPADDPLFIAEHVAALDASQNGGLVFENPRLMREFGLIVVNIDGFDDPANRFVMRGVQHLQGLQRTIEPAPNLDQPLVQLLGWSGDGSTGTGSLREFADGAVTQHFPRTMHRVAGQDFRLPTPRELNALEAFMLSIGRDEDMDVQRPLSDPRAERGRQLFTGIPACNQCHLNGGADSNFSGGIGIGNFLANTGVELNTQRFPDGTGEARPVDGGFGTNPQGDFLTMEPNPDGSFGERTFNAQSVIEAASTLPAFHSNLTANPASGLEPTIEGAIRFYTTPEFEEGAGFPIDLSEQDISDLGKFLRVLSALDDVRTATEYATRAARAFEAPVPSNRVGNRLAVLAAQESRDARSVLEPVGLHPESVDELTEAAAAFASATGGAPAVRIQRIQAGLAALERIPASILD